jgi:pyrophosphatase PpaX
MEIKNVIFDFDGTVADTLPVLFHASERVFQKYDRRMITLDEFRGFMGPTELIVIEQNLLARDRIAEAIESFLQEYEDAHEDMVQRDEEIAAMLQELRTAGIGLALFTGKSRRTLDISLAKLDWQVPFDYIVTGDDVSRPKPSSEGIEQILQMMKWRRQETVFIGDSIDDQLAGQAAGVRTLAAGWMKLTQNTQDHFAPDRYFDQLSSLRSYLNDHIVRRL